LNSLPLVYNALKIISVVGLPCGIAGWAASILPVPAILQILAGLGTAGLYFLAALIAVPWIRADVKFSLMFIKRSMSRSGAAVTS